MKVLRGVTPFLLAASLIAASPAKLSEDPVVRSAIDRVSADSLRGHVSFLASDLLEGRDTPSRGLDIAAEYIASQFRAAGIKPAGNDGYFQTADWLVLQPQTEGFEMTVDAGGKTFRVKPEQVRPQNDAAVELDKAPVVRLKPGDEIAADSLKGKVATLLLDRAAMRGFFAMRERLRAARPALTLIVTADAMRGGRTETLREGGLPPEPPSVTVRDAEMFQALQDSGAASLSLKLRAPDAKHVSLKNVAGVLPGADPQLKSTYILVTAHYDHIGISPVGSGDRIYNGANDDASGAASVIELASALAHAGRPPKRSVVFMTFFGEEKGLLGSRYYGSHPLFPIARTIAEVNLEQMGRTDASEGPEIGTLTFTGYDYSSLPATFAEAGAETGVKVWKHPDSDAYFARSDNQALADLGVPAHTIGVAFMYPDYHQPGDEWPKLDYDNMAKVDRTIALGLFMLADSAEAPKWNESSSGASRYAQAWKKLHAEE